MSSRHICLSIRFPDCVASCRGPGPVSVRAVVGRCSTDWNFKFDLETQVGALALQTFGFNKPLSAQCSIAGHPQLGNSARSLSERCA